MRIEATRLRAALEQFYQATGTPLGVRLDLPRGKYYPVFMPAPVSSPVPPPSCEEGQFDPVPSDPAPPDPAAHAIPQEDSHGSAGQDRMPEDGAIPAHAAAPRPAQGVAGILVVGLTLAVRLLAFLPAGFSTGRPLAASAAYIEKPSVEFVIEGDARAPPMMVETVNDILVAAGHFSTIRPHFRGLEPVFDAGAASDYVVGSSGLSGPQMPLRWRISSLYASFALYRPGIERQTLIKGWSMPLIRCPRRVSNTGEDRAIMLWICKAICCGI